MKQNLNNTFIRIRNCLDTLVNNNLATITNNTVQIANNGRGIITWGTGIEQGNALSAKPFASIEEYSYYLKYNMLNALLYDGSFLQISYIFENNQVIEHRLCYYPCPFDLDSDLLVSEPVLDVVECYMNKSKYIRIRTPIRFDYRKKMPYVGHSESHVHLNKDDCRCPLVGPIDIWDFVKFIIYNFYSDRFQQIFGKNLQKDRWSYDHTITEDERQLIHFALY
jgi:hypothetical protein